MNSLFLFARARPCLRAIVELQNAVLFLNSVQSSTNSGQEQIFPPTSKSFSDIFKGCGIIIYLT
jgi:hypothetical protein